jgi:hypothetical protein
MSAKMGRPKLPKEEIKGILIGARFSPQEAKDVEGALRQSFQSKSKLVREAVMKAAHSPPVWLKTKWQRDDLQNKRAEFFLPIAGGGQIHGFGKFAIKTSPKGLLSFEIFCDVEVAPNAWTQHRIQLHRQTVEAIQLHPDQNVAQFLLKL